jgi:hypothetical protein
MVNPDVTLTNATGIALCITNDYAIAIVEQSVTAKLVFANQYNQTNDFVVLSVFGETAVTQYGYTLPETEVFTLANTGTQFTLSNYVGGDNPKNAIVEYEGERLTNIADYSINSSTNQLNLTFTPTVGDTLSVTSYNLTDRQYLHTTYGGSFSGSTTNNLVIGSTTHLLGSFDEDTPSIYTYDQNTPTIVPYDMVLDYLTISSGDTSSLNVNDAIQFVAPTIGGIVAGQTYYIVQIINSTDFSISETVGGIAFTVTDDTGSMYGITNPPTVANITAINNSTNEPLAVTNVTATTVTTNLITCGSTFGFQLNQPVIFKNSTGIGFGNVDADGTVYYIKSISGGTSFTISETLVAGVAGPTLTLTTDSGSMVAYVGGNEAIIITTGIAHNLVTNDVVRIDGVLGSTELNNNIYYAKVINATQISLYFSTYSAIITYVNDPVTVVSSYSGGGYVWLDKTFTLTTTSANETTASNDRITVEDSSELIVGTPIIFTGTMFGGLQSTVNAGSFTIGDTYQIIETGTTSWTTLGSLSNDPGTTFVATGSGSGTGTATAIYYVYDVPTATTFRVTAARDGGVYGLSDATGLINVTQWEQTNVDRLWVTVNGKRIPSSALYLNPQNNLSILTTVTAGDVVIITSMMPSATPNQAVYIQNVNKNGDQAIFRANSLTRTWLTYGLQDVDNIIYVEDVAKLTESLQQEVTAPAVVLDTMSIGLIGDKNTISQVIVYNNTTSLTIDPASYNIVVESLAPILKIDIDPDTPAIEEDDSLTITIIVGNLIYVNGELIRFTTVDFVNNTLSGLQRGSNGTGARTYIPKYTEVYSVLSSNMLPELYNGFSWNSFNYNLVTGDPLQISTTFPANFLNADVP